MTRSIFCLASILVLLCGALPIQAQQAGSDVLPAMVKFADTLTGSDGKPLHGVVGVNFYLYNDKSSGTPLWMETQNVRVDKGGHYSVMLGSASASGLPEEAFTGGGARWLGVQVSGEAEQPRTFLFSLPYDGQPSHAGIQPSHEAVITNPQQTQKLPPTVHGNGVANFLPLWTDTKVVSESVIAQNGSNIGIGTAFASTTLDVFSGTPGVHAPMAQFGSAASTDSNSILTYNGSGRTEMFQSGCAGCFVPGSLVGDGGVRVGRGNHILFGDSGASRLILDGSGNAQQTRSAGGMVKAMILYDGLGSGTLVRCFNSALFGAAATKPPCGFTADKAGTGDYIFNLGFEVDDRFFSLSSNGETDSIAPNQLNICTSGDPCNRGHSIQTNEVEVTTLRDDTFTNTLVIVLVY